MKNNLRNLLAYAFMTLSLSSFAQEDNSYPLRVIDRAGIMPVGIAEFEIASHLREITKGAGLKTLELDSSVTFGVVKALQATFSYDGFQFNPFEHKAKFGLGTKYNYYSRPGFSAYLNTSLPIYVHGDIIREFSVGLPVTFYNHILAYGFGRNLVKVVMRPYVAGEINFNAWFGMQVYGNLWADLTTNFGTLHMENFNGQAKFDKSVGFWKVLPLELGLIYGVTSYLDLGANAAFDNIISLDNFSFGVKVNLRAGNIFG